MNCLIDTNILISASLFPESVPAKAFTKATIYPNVAVVCDYSLDELRRVYNKKFPHKLHVFEHFLSLLMLSVKIISTPAEDECVPDENKIRDLNDRPILRAAVKYGVDILVTGDKDFLEAGLENPKIMTAAEFVNS